MFRKKIINLYDDQGRVSQALTVSELKELSLNDLKSYLVNTESVIRQHALFVSDRENTLMLTFGYPSIEATQKGMRSYADGSVQKQMDDLNASMAALRNDLAGITPIATPTAAEQAKKSSFMKTATDAAKMYLKTIAAGEELQTQAKILRSVMASKEEQLTVSPISHTHN